MCDVTIVSVKKPESSLTVYFLLIFSTVYSNLKLGHIQIKRVDNANKLRVFTHFDVCILKKILGCTRQIDQTHTIS